MASHALVAIAAMAETFSLSPCLGIADALILLKIKPGIIKNTM